MRTRLSALLAVSALTLAACSSPGPNGTKASGQQEAAPSGTTYRIGITQIAAHPSLDALAQGFKDALKEAGIQATYDEQNAQGDQSVAASIAGNFQAAKLDLVLAIATPTAQAVATAVKETPIVFTGVTDPVAAGLVNSWESPGGSITGVSDKNPIDNQISLVKELAPNAKTLGIVYSSAEENSVIQTKWATEAAEKLGMQVRTVSVSTTSEVQQAAQSLDVDAFWVGTDNTVVTAIESLIQVAETKKVPLIVSDGDSVKRGATATFSFNYYDMGLQTGKMAVRILRGEKPSSIPVETSQKLVLHLNTAAAERMGLTIPQSLQDKAEKANIYTK